MYLVKCSKCEEMVQPKEIVEIPSLLDHSITKMCNLCYGTMGEGGTKAYETLKTYEVFINDLVVTEVEEANKHKAFEVVQTLDIFQGELIKQSLNDEKISVVVKEKQAVR